MPLKSLILLLFFFPSLALPQAIFEQGLTAGNVNVQTNTISTVNTNGNLVFDLNGTGKLEFTDLTASRVPYLDSNKRLTSSVVTQTELEFLGGVESSLCGNDDICILTNKILTAPEIDGAALDFGTATNTNFLKLPSDTTSNLDALTDVEGLLGYDETQQKPVFNNGSGWTPIGTGGGSGFFNLISEYNWDFEKSAGATEDWTASGGTFAAALTTNILDGLQSVTWDSGSASQTLSSTSVTVPNGMFGRNGWAQCKIFTPSGTATHKIQVYDGTNVISEQTITSSSTTKPFSGTSFIWPSTGSLVLRLISVASDEPLIAVDSCGVYDADEIKLTNISQASFIGAASFNSTANCIWARNNTAIGAYGTDADCPAITVETNPGPGTISTVDTDLPQITVNNLPAGHYMVISSFTLASSSSNIVLGAALNDGTTTTGGMACFATATSNECGMTVVGYFTYLNPGSRTFSIYGSASGNSVNLRNDSGGRSVNFRIYRYPLASEQTQTYDTAKWKIDANISGANISLGTSAQTAYVTPNNGSLTLTKNTGSDPVGISCSSTNDNTVGSTTCSAGSEEPGIVVNVPRAGTVEWCFDFGYLSTNAATSAVQTTFQVVETANGSQAVGTQGNTRVSVNQNGQSRDLGVPVHICGIIDHGSAGKKTIRLMYEQSVTLTPTAVQINADADTNNGQRDIHVTARYIDQSPNAMTVKNSVVNSSNGVTATEVGYLRCQAASSIISQHGSWISSIGNVSTGGCTIVISAGFTATPYCFVQLSDSAGAFWTDPGAFLSAKATSTTSVSVDCDADGGANCSDYGFQLMCVGAK